MIIAENVITDPQAPDSFLFHRPAFLNLLDSELLETLSPFLSQRLDIRTFMQCQYLAAGVVADYANDYQNEIAQMAANIRFLLRDYARADLLLRTFGCPERQYCTRAPGLMDWEYDLMRAGCWRVRDLVERRPVAILSPILRAIPWDIFDSDKPLTRHIAA